MKFFYSNSVGPNLSSIPDQSLGGYVSITQIRSAVLCNLFPSISQDALNKGQKDVRMIILQNDTGNIINNLSLFIVPDSGSYEAYNFIAVSPTTDSCGNALFESIQTSSDIPYNGEIFKANDPTNPVIIAETFANNAYIGLWIIRAVNVDAYKAYKSTLICADYQYLKDIDQSTFIKNDILTFQYT